MPGPFHRLVYYSRNLIEPATFGDELAGILASSRRNNVRAGITGALLFSSNGFGQVLEGPRRAVEATFERIQQDDRHGEVVLLAFEEVGLRSFPNWSMSYHGPGAGEAVVPAYAAIGTAAGFDPRLMSADRILETLKLLTRTADATA